MLNGKQYVQAYTTIGKPSWPDPVASLSERWRRYKISPGWETFKYLFKLLLILYLYAQLRPFIIDPPYCALFLLTLAPFLLYKSLRSSITTMLLVVTLLYFFVTRPLVFPSDPDSLLFNERFFKFENYKYMPEAYDALPQLFPVGTPKDKVYRILVKRGGAKEWGFGRTAREKNTFAYEYHSHSGPLLWWKWSVVVTYDNSNQVHEMHVGSDAIPLLP